MTGKKYNNRWVIRLFKGEEIVSSLISFCQNHHCKAGSITGIGAIDSAKIGFYDPVKKQYSTRDYKEDFEITSLLGNLSTREQELHLHLHINMANSNFEVFGGHLYAATVSVTAEIFLDQIDQGIERHLDDETGLYLLSL